MSGTVPAGSAGNYSGIVITVTAPPTVGVAELQWTAPTKNEDGTALTNLAGYKVRYGTSPGALSEVRDVTSPAQTSITIGDLTAGTWYFTVSSYTNTGIDSAPTGAVSKTIT